MLKFKNWYYVLHSEVEVHITLKNKSNLMNQKIILFIIFYHQAKNIISREL